jgi:hypothetical protein
VKTTAQARAAAARSVQGRAAQATAGSMPGEQQERRAPKREGREGGEEEHRRRRESDSSRRFSALSIASFSLLQLGSSPLSHPHLLHRRFHALPRSSLAALSLLRCCGDVCCCLLPATRLLHSAPAAQLSAAPCFPFHHAQPYCLRPLQSKPSTSSSAALPRSASALLSSCSPLIPLCLHLSFSLPPFQRPRPAVQQLLLLLCLRTR